MRVIVVHGNAVRLAAALEPPRRAAKLAERRRRLLPRDTAELERHEGARRVPPVVRASERQLDVCRRQLPPAHGLRHRVEPRVEHRLQLGLGGERRMVVELHVGHDRDLRSKALDRPIGLVPLHDEPAVAAAGISS